ncbi:hypothetical protein ACQP2F_15610 [Actinoplanes sp. CA-030573]|uniref:hypothetical protein n=1 Tax=Actinoplanes sp. CA-030573 TaxID=3239898 RepID=UPI003D8D9885
MAANDGSYISVNTDHLAEGGQHLHGLFNGIRQCTDTLYAEMKPMFATWDGTSRGYADQTFVTARRMLDEFEQSILALSKATTNAGLDQHQDEMARANLWQTA